MITKTHHYFILNVNPWPIIISVSSFNLLFSLGMFLKFSDYILFSLNILNVSICAFTWWMSMSNELSYNGLDSYNLEHGMKFSMILFISSEIFFFFSFFWSYFHFYLAPSMETGMMWPPILVKSFDCLNVPLINTILLLSSGVTVTISHLYFNKGLMLKSSMFLSFTITLGILFSSFQYMEYKNSFFSLNDSTFGTSFFILTGFHGIHVLIGTIFLMIAMIRSNYSKKMNFLMFELASWYWHFVDVVWIFLYFFLYYINNI